MRTKEIPLKQQVVSLEVAQDLNIALKKAGIEIEPHYWWEVSYHAFKGKKEKDCYKIENISSEKLVNKKPNEHPELHPYFFIPTYTLPEMLKIFPKSMIVPSKKTMSNEVVWAVAMVGGARGKGTVGLMNFSCQDGGYRFYKAIHAEVNLAAAAALLIIWCMENGHLDCINETQTS